MAFRVFAPIALIILAQTLPTQAQRKSDRETTLSSALFLEPRQTISFSLSRRSFADTTGGPRITSILEEAGMGALMGVLFSLPSGLIANKLSNGEGLGSYGSTVIGMYVGYVIGTSFGVYGVLGTGAAIGIKNVMNLKNYGTVLVVLFPIAFPISYVELLQ